MCIRDRSGLVFVPGKGNGTFGSPVLFSQQNTSASQELLVADLNNDKKPDLIWNGAVYLGNGDGTFQQMPLGLSGTPLAIADLNGDGIPDVVMGVTVPGSASVYAGNGNGTFQPSPFYTVPLQYESVTSASVGDVNADGHPDLLLQYSTTTSANAVLVLLGDGRGNFSADNNTYYTTFFDGSSGGVLARLNDQAPKLPNDNALDYLSFSIGAVTALLNQTNPKPTPPALTSNTTLAVSAKMCIRDRIYSGLMPKHAFPTGTRSPRNASLSLLFPTPSRRMSGCGSVSYTHLPHLA